MRVYFLSSIPCALTLNGEYFGKTDNFFRFAEVALTDNTFVQFLPENKQPICFYLTEQITTTPPSGITVCLLPDALILYACDFIDSDCTLRVIAQARERDCLATLFSQGRVCLSIQTRENFFIAYLPPSFSKSTLFFHQNLLFVQSSVSLAIFNKIGERLLIENILSLDLQGHTLQVDIPLYDSENSAAHCQYTLSDNTCALDHRTVSARENAPLILPAYTFLETVKNKGNYQEFLSDELIDAKENIRPFLGDFSAILPTERQDVCILLYQKNNALFEGVVCSVQMQNGKIVDITT